MLAMLAGDIRNCNPTDLPESDQHCVETAGFIDGQIKTRTFGCNEHSTNI